MNETDFDPVEAIFSQEGYLSRAFAGYVPRAGQVALARAVNDTLWGGGHLLSEAPCGTGKGLAYAGPASYFAVQRGRPIVLVTANIALQEQLVTKDLPLLASVVPWKFSFALLKGRSNYLCVDKYMETKTRPPLFDKAEERRQLKILAEWAQASCHDFDGETGDVSELDFEPLHNVWRHFSVSPDDCKKHRCKFKDECFANKAQDGARLSHLIVTNYHMLFAHLSVYMQTGVDVILPPFAACVLDEAHKAPDIARDFFGWKITEDSLHRIARSVGGDTETQISLGAKQLFALFEQLKKDRARYKARLTYSYSDYEQDAWRKLSTGLTNATTVLDEQLARANEAEVEAGRSGLAHHDPKAFDRIRDEADRAGRSKARAVTAFARLRAAMGDDEEPGAVHFLEEDEKKRVTIGSKVVHSKDILGPHLFGKHARYNAGGEEGVVDLGPVSVIATSATLTTDRDSFDYAAEELGAPADARKLVAESPFDWQRQALFVVPEGLPLPNDEKFKDQMCAALEHVIRLAGGRTLGLFTSRKMLDAAHDAVAPYCRVAKIKLFKQGDGPRTKLVQQFREDTTSVLLGTESFWAGVDVPGESLSVVVIDRLPFPTPDDPVLDALSQFSSDTFGDYSVPRAIIAFKQGFGRLIRSSACRGAVVCMDMRIAEKAYGRKFLRSLPKGLQKTRDMNAIAGWLSPPSYEGWDEA